MARSRSSKPRASHYDAENPMTMATLDEIKRVHAQLPKLESDTTTYIHDFSSPFYPWLLPGWLVEERVVASGRVYKYYFDPCGNQYDSKASLKAAWAKAGFIVVDF